MRCDNILLLAIVLVTTNVIDGYHFIPFFKLGKNTGLLRLSSAFSGLSNSRKYHQFAASVDISPESRKEFELERADRPPYKFNVQQDIYMFLSNLFVTSLIVSDVIGVKIFSIDILGKQIHHTCGMLSFPITFLISDIINEYYGPKATQKTVYIGLIMSVFVFGIIHLAQALPFLDRAFNGTYINDYSVECLVVCNI